MNIDDRQIDLLTANSRGWVSGVTYHVPIFRPIKGRLKLALTIVEDFSYYAIFLLWKIMLCYKKVR